MTSVAQPATPATTDASASAEAAARLTKLLEENSAFSFLRLGDGELRMLLAHQNQESVPTHPDLRPSCEIAYGSPGLARQHGARLLRSYEECSFLDLYGELPYNRANLPRLRWTRAANTLGTASSSETGLVFSWVFHELRRYLAAHRCVVCGAEASLLRELHSEPAFRTLAAPYWPENAAVSFLQPRGDGARLAEDLDRIKDDLREAVRAQRADTLFLSLGGGAKILAHELAQELGIRTIDFGSALRALTYSGSDGQASWRAPHHPFLLRVPLDLFFGALRRAHPTLSTPVLLAKAHAQLCLELQRKELLQSCTSDANDPSVFDPSPENLRHFGESFRYYRSKIEPLARGDADAEALAREFRVWRRKKGLGLDGRLFRLGVAAKGALRRAGLISNAP